MNEHEPLPVSLAALVEELRRQTEVEPDEYPLTQILAYFPDRPRNTIYGMLQATEKKGQITSRLIGHQRYYRWTQAEGANGSDAGRAS